MNLTRGVLICKVAAFYLNFMLLSRVLSTPSEGWRSSRTPGSLYCSLSSCRPPLPVSALRISQAGYSLSPLVPDMIQDKAWRSSRAPGSLYCSLSSWRPPRQSLSFSKFASARQLLLYLAGSPSWGCYQHVGIGLLKCWSRPQGQGATTPELTQRFSSGGRMRSPARSGFTGPLPAADSHRGAQHRNLRYPHRSGAQI